MESGSQPDLPPNPSSQRLASLVGTFIALLTLAVPLLAIAYFSSSSLDLWQPTPVRIVPRE
jgi:hypothetical protein